MDTDESVSLTQPKTPSKPGQKPEEVSLTHKTPAEIKPTVRIDTFKFNTNITYLFQSNQITKKRILLRRAKQKQN